jgi:uncharacterized protein (TIGR02271 family)
MAEHESVSDARAVVPGDAPGEPEEVLRLPEVEERLRVERRRIALGFIEVRKTVVTERVMVPVELRREVVEIRLVDDPGGVATVGEAHVLKDDTIRIPVFREKAVVRKEIVVTSEVVIDRTLLADERTIDETLRRATVTVDEDPDRDDPPAFLDRAGPRPEDGDAPTSERSADGHPVRPGESG